MCALVSIVPTFEGYVENVMVNPEERPALSMIAVSCANGKLFAEVAPPDEVAQAGFVHVPPDDPTQ